MAKKPTNEIDSLTKEISFTPKNNKKYGALLNELNKKLIDSKDSTIKFKLDKAVTVCLKLKDSIQIAKAYHNLGVYHMTSQEYTQSEIFLKKSIAISKSRNYSIPLAKTYVNMAIVSIYQSKQEQGIRYFEEGKLALKDLNSKESIKIKTLILLKLGGLYNLLEQHDKSLNALYAARGYAEITKDSASYSGTSINISVSFFQINSLKKALYYGLQAVNYAPTGGSKIYIREYALINLASIYSELDQLDSAEFFYQKVLDSKKSNNNGTNSLAAVNGLGDIYVKKGETEKGFELLHEALVARKKLNNDQQLVYSYSSLSAGHLYTKSIDSALFYLDKCLSKAKKINDIRYISSCYKMQYKAYKAQKNYQKALLAHEQYRIYYDSLNLISESKKLGFLEADFTFRKKHREQEELIAQKDKVHNAEIRASRLRQSLLIISLLILLLALLWLLYHYKQRKKRNHTIQHQNRQISRSNSVIKKNKEELDALVQELKISNGTLENFAQLAAHDIKSPLTTIIDNAKLLENYLGVNIEDAHLTHILSIKKSVQNMTAMIDGLLKFSFLFNKLPRPEKFDLNEILNKAESNLSETIKQSNATITKENDMAHVVGHQSLVLQLFQNILANALKFKKSTIDSQITINCKPTNDNFITISIQDNGIGISEEDKTEIFEKYKRAHSADKFEGYGLGLSTAYKIVDYYGGKIWVESQLKKGTTVFFTLPSAA